MLIILSGSSGCGKNTIIHEVMKTHPEVQILKSCTTRASRGPSDDGYFFLSEKEFNQKIKNNEFYEVQEVHKGIFYGTLLTSIEKAMGDNVFMKDVDVIGTQKLKKILGDKLKTIYLDVPKRELHKRLIGRGESEESAKKRLSIYEYEKSFMKDYDLIIKNKNLDETVAEIINYIWTDKKV